MNNSKKEVKRAVAYARYSSGNQREESIEEQMIGIERYAKENNIRIIGQYEDQAKSASKNLEKRDGFLTMINDITSKKIEVDYVIVYCLSRFMRNRFEAAINRKKLEEAGVKLLSATEKLTDSPESIILESVLEGMNEYFSKNLSQEVKRGLFLNASKALHTGGQPPLGYKIVDMKLVVNEDERPIIEHIFNSFVEGKSLATIAKELNAMGYRTRSGKPFKPSSFYDLLSNEKYIGTYVYNKTEGCSFGGKRNGHKYKSDDEIIRLENQFEPIVSKEVFDRVQQIRNSRKYKGGRANAKHNYLLSGLVFCGECEPRDDGKLYSYCGNARKPSGKKSEYISYRCSNTKAGCKNKEIRKEYLEEFALNVLEEDIFNERSLKYIVKGINRTFANSSKKSNETILMIDKNIESIEVKINNILKAIKEGIFDQSFNDELKKLREMKYELEEKKSQEEKKVKDPIVVTESDLKGMIGEFKEYIRNRNIEECKQFIHKFVNRVIVYRDRIEVEYKFNLNFIEDDSVYFQMKDISREEIIETYKERYTVNDMNDYLHQRVIDTNVPSTVQKDVV